MDFEKEVMQSEEIQNSSNPLSDRYKRNSNFNKNILKKAGEELIINPNNALMNKSSQKSLFSPRYNSNRKIKKIYNPYLISACKHAIIREKRELPNYKEIIRNINTEFGIEEEKHNINSHNKNKFRLRINTDSDNPR